MRTGSPEAPDRYDAERIRNLKAAAHLAQPEQQKTRRIDS